MATTSLMIAAVATGASASAGTTPRLTRISQGVNPTKVKGATRESATPASTPITVSFILKERNETALASKVEAGWTGAYLTTQQFAAEYGQSPAYITDLEGYLGHYGLSTTAQSDRLEVAATGTAKQIDKALSVLESNFDIPAAHGHRAEVVRATRANPALPTSLASGILSVLGLTNYQPFASDAVRSKHQAASSTSASGTPTIPAGELTPADFVSRYKLASTEAAGSLGQGRTIGIVTLASLSPKVPTYFWKQILGIKTLPDRITLTNVDGGAGPVSLTAGSDETTLDVEQSGAIAPQARIDVYQAPNTDAGFVDAYYHVASDNVADSVSASWGESETEILLSTLDGTESPTYTESFDQAFLELAAQGQSNFVSAGDSGAFDADDDAATTNLSVDNPGDSPYVTNAGATTLPTTLTLPVDDSSGNPTGATESVTIPKEISWSWDYLWPLYKALGDTNETDAVNANIVGGGGGYSSYYAQPTYQTGVSGVDTASSVDYLTPTGYTDTDGVTLPTTFSFDANPTVSSTTAPSGRAVPDLSTDGDPETGYAVYDPQYTAAYGSSIQQFGGTSFVAPQLNASAVVLASKLGHRLGFWNPVIYAAAQTKSSPLTPIDDSTIYGSSYFSATTTAGTTEPLSGSFSNNNLYYTGTAGTVYNAASGLGTPDLGRLASFFTQP